MRRRAQCGELDLTMRPHEGAGESAVVARGGRRLQKVGTLGGFSAPGLDKHAFDLGVYAGRKGACTDPGRKNRPKSRLFAEPRWENGDRHFFPLLWEKVPVPIFPFSRYWPWAAYLTSVASLAGRHQASWSRYHWMVCARPVSKSVWAGRQPSSRRSLVGSMA